MEPLKIGIITQVRVTSTRLPLIERERALSASASLPMTQCGMSLLISPANSMKRVGIPTSRAFQVK